MLKNFQIAQDVTILHHFPYYKGSLINRINDSLYYSIDHITYEVPLL